MPTESPAVFVSTPVHPVEISPYPEDPPPLALFAANVPLQKTPSLRTDLADVNFRHSGWRPTRTRVFRAMQATDTPSARLERYSECGTNAWVMRSLDDNKLYKIASSKCHDRFCVACGNERSRVIAHNVQSRITAKVLRFVTLTLRSGSEPLADTCSRLTRCFSRLRSRQLWKSTVTGGVGFLEIKRSARLDRWHAHLHLIVEGKYIPKASLKKAWHEVTGDSFVVDIRFVHDKELAAKYVTKYASKPMDPSIIRDADLLREAIEALRSRRLCLTFGTWRGVSLTETPDDGEWITVCSLTSLLAQIHNGDTDALQFLRRIAATGRGEARAPPPQPELPAWEPEPPTPSPQLKLFEPLVDSRSLYEV